MRGRFEFWWRPGGRYRLSYLYVLIGALVLLAGLLLLYPVRHVDGFGTELRINIGSNLLDLVLAVLVLQPLVLSLNRNAVQKVPARYAELLQVRISSVGPAHAFYRVDDWLSYGLFRDRRVSESYQREVRVRGDLGGLALEAFGNRWNGAGLRGIAAHYRIRLRFTLHGTVVEHDLRYVIHDGDHWVDATPAAFHPDHEVSMDGRQRYILVGAAPETQQRVAALYAAKYGPGQSALLLRLIERTIDQ
jgi:hypothetical protein